MTPSEKAELKRELKRMLVIALVALILFALWKLYSGAAEYRSGEETYDAAKRLFSLDEPIDAPTEAGQKHESIIFNGNNGYAVSTDPTGDSNAADEMTAVLANKDLSQLQTVNGDILAWLYVPDTEISYPVAFNGNNTYYLDHTWDGKQNAAGTIFLDQRNSPYFSDYNTILYGHNMRNGTMFGGLKSYKKLEYLQAHPVIYLVTEEGCRCYQIFAAYEAETESDTFNVTFFSDSSQEDFAVNCARASKPKTDLIPSADTPILTLCTCTGSNYSKRLVVQGYLTEILERDK